MNSITLFIGRVMVLFPGLGTENDREKLYNFSMRIRLSIRSSMNIAIGFSVAVLSSMAPLSARATSVWRVDGKQIEIDVTSDTAISSDTFYYLLNAEGVRQGIIRIESVADKKAFGTLHMGKAETGWTLRRREGKKSASKTNANKGRLPASEDGGSATSGDSPGHSSAVSSGFYFEPYLGYFSGTLDATYDASLGGGSSSATGSGLAFGAKLGYAFPVVFLALSAGGGSGKTTSSSGTQTDVVPVDIALEVGASFWQLRIWGAYVNETLKAESTSSSTEYTGSGYKLGVSYTGFDMISINFEMLPITYTKLKSDSISLDLGPGKAMTAKSNVYILSLSLPIGF